MHKILLSLTVLLLCSGCVSQKYPPEPIRAISNIEGTKIYLNDEYQGTDSTVLYILQKKSSTSYVRGIHKNCEKKEIQIEHVFDFSVLNVLDLRNIGRILTGNWWIVDTDKDLYNVTPDCK